MTKISLKTRITICFIAVIITTSAISTFVGIKLIDKSIVPRIQDKVRYDLNSAHELLQNEVINIKDIIRLTSSRFFMRESILANDIERLSGELKKIQRMESFDILNLADAEGNIIVRARNPGYTGDNRLSIEIVSNVLTTKNIFASTEIFSREELIKEGDDLAARAYCKIIPSPRMKSAYMSEETSGMIMLGAAPVLGDDGEVLGVLYGGKLLNNNDAIVDRIRDAIYGREKYKGKEIGAITIFLNILRIATNVIDDDGKRAVGTYVADEVYNRVLIEGKTLNKIEFAVNDWYITAYEPIKNASGDIIGILGLGVLESKYKDMEKKALLIFLIITMSGIILALVIGYFLTRTIMHPINSIYQATQKLADGNLEQQIELDDSTKEIAALGKAFTFMVSSIKQRDEQLRRHTQEEIMRSERLAMVGQLAAGVAHEINNPLGGILLFSGLLLKQVPPESTIRENLVRIEKEAKRCQNIVQGLLEFAREREPKMETVRINDVVEKSINLFANQPSFHNIEVVKNYESDLPNIFADPSQLQQVLVNIIMNASDAMKGQGVLTITTGTRSGDDSIEVSITDTGKGMSPDQLEHVFEPFYTTKGIGHGTGLGLSISYGIVQRHGGNIKAFSEEGAGSTFIVMFPIDKGNA